MSEKKYNFVEKPYAYIHKHHKQEIETCDCSSILKCGFLNNHSKTVFELIELYKLACRNFRDNFEDLNLPDDLPEDDASSFQFVVMFSILRLKFYNTGETVVNLKKVKACDENNMIISYGLSVEDCMEINGAIELLNNVEKLFIDLSLFSVQNVICSDVCQLGENFPSVVVQLCIILLGLEVITVDDTYPVMKQLGKEIKESEEE